MIRRLQLLGPEGRFSARRAAAVVDRVRESLLHDNRVVPVVLAVLALLIFAWLVAGFLVGDPGEEEVASQGALSQAPEDPGSAETPAPEVENRDTDSYAVFESKDPFRDIIPKAGEEDRLDQAARENGLEPGSDRDRGADRGRGDFIDQSSPGEPGSEGRRDAGGSAGAAGQGSGTGRGGSGDLFDSGGNLPAP